jgi:hypothetical protein
VCVAFAAARKRLSRKHFDTALAEAEALILIPPEIEQIAASSTRADLPKLKALRMRALGYYDLYGAPFWAWTEIVKRVMRKG